MADVITRLRLETTQFDSKLRDASKELADYTRQASAAGNEFGRFTQKEVEAARALGSIQSGANNAKDKVRDLVGAFNTVAKAYDNLTTTQKQSDFGKALAESMQQLKGRITEAKKDLYDLGDAGKNGSALLGSGGLSSVLGELGNKLGLSSNLTTALTTGTLGLASAVSAATAAVGAAAKAWAEYNLELGRQEQIVGVTTGARGAAADRIGDAARSLSKIYGADFREVVNAANTLMTQFGQTGDESIRIIRDGMQGMIVGDAPKLLSMIQQYAPAFRDAGVSASQLVAVIQNSEGGIFTDQNMNAIVMGIKNIRLMTKATSEALRQVGIDGEEMTRKLNDGSLSVFEALKEVSIALEKTSSGSQAAGEVMQQVFGRQGTMMGTNLAKAIAELNLNLEETKKQTGELGESFARMERAEASLNTALRETFGMDNFETLGNDIRSEFVGSIAEALTGLHETKQAISAMGPVLRGLLGPIGGLVGAFDDMKKASGDSFNAIRLGVLAVTPPIVTLLQYISRLGSIGKATGSITQTFSEGNIFTQWIRQQYGSGGNTSNIPPIVPPTTPRGTGGGTHQPTPAEQAAGKFSAAEANYQQAVDFAAAQLKAKTITEQDYAKKILAAEESLWKAIAGARELADDPKYKTAQEEVEKRMAAQGVKISELTEQLEARRKAEREAEAAAREQAAAEKKLMEALAEVATAYGDNNLGGYLAAMKKVGGDAGQGIAAGGFTATPANLGSFQSLLREQLAGADIGSSLYASLSSQLADATTLGTLISAAVKNGIDVAQLPTQELWKQLFSENPGDYIDDSVWQGLVDKINEELKKIGKDPIQIDLKTGNIANVAKQTKDSWQDAARAVQAVGGALQQLEDPAAKVAGIVGQAIANIALGFAEATAKDSKLGVFGWIAAIAGGLGTMISTISAIKSATAGSYAEGGVIPGNSYSGDNQLALVNAGEIILNRAQQGNVAEGLMGNSLADMRLYTEISGENLRVVLDNSSLRRGRGRYVTAKR